MHQNPFVLALIGAPTLLGIYLRFLSWSPAVIKLNMLASSIVLASVGIGYSFATYASPNDFILHSSRYICIFIIFLLPWVLIYVAPDEYKNQYTDIAAVIFWIVFPLSTFGIGSMSDSVIFMPPAVIFLFCLFACLNSVLGTLVSGFSISATLHSYISTGTLDYIFLWKDVFEFFEIGSLPIKIMIVVVTALAGAAELLHLLQLKARALLS